MMFPLFRRSQRRATISILYGTIVAQARLPSFYRDFGVADTLSGRFELILLHLALVLERIAQDPGLRDLGQALFDHFCRDMDDNLREIGVGDLAVPKQMQRVGEAFYGRATAYSEAMRAGESDALADALNRNIYGGSQASAAGRLALYVRKAAAGLQDQGSVDLRAGRLVWPLPAAAGQS